jgi:hypothetical protein
VIEGATIADMTHVVMHVAMPVSAAATAVDNPPHHD